MAPSDLPHAAPLGDRIAGSGPGVKTKRANAGDGSFSAVAEAIEKGAIIRILVELQIR